jgi:hypothetical protein
MKNGINGYGGLMLDAGYDSIQNTFYIDALNIRITTTRGESQGSATNIKGNSFYFNILQTGRFPDEPGGTLWNANNAEIIGATSIRDKIILFVADDDFQGWIYEIDYNETDCTLVSRTLKYYSTDLNFRKEWPIEAVGRYESDCYRRIYWSDYNNPFRALNLEAPNLDTLPVGLIDSFPDVEFTMPLLTSVAGGGALPVGTYQYAYRLITEDGKKTLISPGGNLIHCVKDSESLSQSRRYTGEPEGTNSGKSHQITINTSNYSDYEKIELVAVFYADLNGTAEITSVEEKDIAGNTSITFLHTGQEDTAVILENFEYSNTQYAFKTIKSLTPKDNSLIVANIKGGSFDIQSLLDSGETFDAEVIRYKSDLTPAADGFNVEYNKDAHWDVDWHANEQFKFQANGTTLGGESPNIKFKFHLEPFIVDGDLQPAFTNLANIPSASIDLGDGYSYINTTYPSMTSPFLNGVLRGYKRGETYRFGIIFYNKKGEASFVEYIGDIKFPDLSEPDGVNNTTGTPYWLLSQETARTGAGVNTTAYALGIEFTLDFSSCPNVLDKIESYQIVRVKRDTEDKRRLCSGLIKTFYEPKDITGDPTAFPTFKAPDGDDKVLHLYNYTLDWGFNANFENLHTKTGHFWKATSETPIRGDHLTFHSPELSYEFNNKNTLGNINARNALLLITGAYAQYYGDTGPLPGPINPNFPEHEIDIQGSDWYDSLSFATTEAVALVNGDDPKLGYLVDRRRKQRTTVPVLKDGTTRDIEYVKVIDELNESLFVGTQDDAELESEKSNNTFKFESIWARNYYADGPRTSSFNSPLSLNSPPDYGAVPGSLSYLEFSKGASGIVLATKKLEIDPLTNTPIGVQSAYPYFYTGSTVGDSVGVEPIAPAVGYQLFNEATGIYENIDKAGIIVPVSGTDYVTNELRLNSRPIVDILIPKQEIYGGLSADALVTNTFIPASPIIDKDLVIANQHTFKVFGGDIFLSMWNFQEGCVSLDRRYYFQSGSGYYSNITTTNSLVVESEINCGVDHGSTFSRGVKYDVSGGASGIKDQIFRQEIGNFSSDYAATLNMYRDGYNEAYSREKDDLFFFTKPSNFDLECTKNDIRAYISNVKINEELIDSWTQFGVNNYYDVDDYGPINKVLNWRDNVHFFQDKAVGAYSINPRAIVTAADGIPTELGSGEGFQDHQYFSTEHGSIHQWAVKATDTGIYYYDAIHNKIFRVSQGNEPLSELNGVHGFLNEFSGDIFLRKEQGGDNPILSKGAHITRDKINDEVLFTFLGTWQPLALAVDITYYAGQVVETSEGDYYQFFEECTTFNPNPPEIVPESELISQISRCSTIITEQELPQSDYTLVYDELAQKFTSFYSATPPIYIENGNILLSPDPDNRQNVFVHNKGNYGEFYNNVGDSSISVVINHEPDINKVLRFIEFNSIVRDGNKNIDREQTITAFRIHNEYQDTGIVPFSTGRIKRRFDKWRLKVPRDTNNQRARLRSTYFILTLYFDNSYNKELILNRIVSHFDLQIY